MKAEVGPGGSVGAAGGVCPRPSFLELEQFVLARVPGVSKAKARRLARAAHREPDPFSAVLGRVVESRMLRGFDPTAATAVARVAGVVS